MAQVHAVHIGGWWSVHIYPSTWEIRKIVGDLLALIDLVGKNHPDVLVIDLGSNDLSQEVCDVGQLVERMLVLANYAKIGHGILAVYFCNVLNRGRCRDVDRQTFSDGWLCLTSWCRKGLKHAIRFISTNLQGFGRIPRDVPLRLAD